MLKDILIIISSATLGGLIAGILVYVLNAFVAKNINDKKSI